MQLSDSTEKMEIVERLVKEGAIDFTEAIKLLEKEPEYIFSPSTQPFQPFQPFQPRTPIDDWWHVPYNPLSPTVIYTDAGVPLLTSFTSTGTGIITTN